VPSFLPYGLLVPACAQYQYQPAAAPGAEAAAAPAAAPPAAPQLPLTTDEVLAFPKVRYTSHID